MTSGQDLGPMPGEVAYAASKAALASITKTLADQLADRGITLNTVNPGPVDTGYAPPDVHEVIRRHFPQGRWGTPDDPARLIAWLATDEAAWITGQVINSEAASAAGTDPALRAPPLARPDEVTIGNVTRRPNAVKEDKRRLGPPGGGLRAVAFDCYSPP